MCIADTNIRLFLLSILYRLGFVHVAHEATKNHLNANVKSMFCGFVRFPYVSSAFRFSLFFLLFLDTTDISFQIQKSIILLLSMYRNKYLYNSSRTLYVECFFFCKCTLILHVNTKDIFTTQLLSANLFRWTRDITRTYLFYPLSVCSLSFHRATQSGILFFWICRDSYTNTFFWLANRPSDIMIDQSKRLNCIRIRET